MNKFFGIVLYVIGVLFIIAFIGQIPKFLDAFLNLFKMFSSEINGLERGSIIGQLIYCIIHIAIIYFAFKYGKRIFKKK